MILPITADAWRRSDRLDIDIICPFPGSPGDHNRDLERCFHAKRGSNNARIGFHKERLQYVTLKCCENLPGVPNIHHFLPHPGELQWLPAETLSRTQTWSNHRSMKAIPTMNRPVMLIYMYAKPARIITASSGVETPLRVPVVVAGAAWKWAKSIRSEICQHPML